MTETDSLKAIFNADIVASGEMEGLILTVFSNGLALVEVKEYHTASAAGFEAAKKFMRTLETDQMYHFIFKFNSFSDVDPEMRKKRAEKDGSAYSLSDAMIISNLPQKMLGDFYMRVHKPVRPTRFFYSLEKAIDWSLKQQRKLKKR